MAKRRSRRRPGRVEPSGRARPRSGPTPRPGASPRAQARARPGAALAGWWRRRSRAGGIGRVAWVALAALIAVNLWLHGPPKPDANAVHSAILAGRTGAEV